MNNQTKKLSLNQETLRNLTASQSQAENFAPTTTVNTRWPTCTCTPV